MSKLEHLSKSAVVSRYLPAPRPAALAEAEAFAPSNIALCKYWGKRERELNLPINSSLSISLGNLGTRTRLSPTDEPLDQVWLNDQPLPADSPFARKVLAFLGLFRPAPQPALRVETWNNIPTAAGLASSASGFAALMLAIDRFYQLQLPRQVLSAFARMGSGSASRSLWHGFVEWEMGIHDDGMDSCGRPLDARWDALRIGLLTLCQGQKPVGSRAGMERTLESSHLYQSWPLQAASDLERLKQAIVERDFASLGQTAEQNALSMHATMIASWPPLLYWQPESVAAMQRIWALREAGLPLYFTMDAGPNLKLLFEAEQQSAVLAAFPSLQVVAPFQAR